MPTHPTVARRLRGRAALALLAAAVGVVLVVVAVAAQVRAPQSPRSVGRIDPPAPSSSGAAPPTAATTPTTPSGGPTEKVLGASRPVSISIPAIGVRSPVHPIGLTPDGALAVPQPGPRLDHAAWFKNSPTPGQPGPSVIEGHVDSESGPSVFFRLGELRPGNRVVVTRADGYEVVYTVNAVRDFPKSKFPTDVVYGGRDLSRPQLRLITCSDFDRSLRTHTGNEVVFAHLTATHAPH